MSPGDLAVGFTLLLSVFACFAVGRAIADWLQSYPDARPHRADIHWQDYGLTDAQLNEQWVRREHAQDERQAMLDATHRVLGRLI